MRVTTVVFALMALALLLCAGLALRLYLDPSEGEAAWRITSEASLIAAGLFLVLFAASLWLAIAHGRLYRQFRRANERLAADAGERGEFVGAMRALLVTLMEDLNEAVIMADPQHQVVAYNSAALWLFEPIIELEPGAVLAVEGDALDSSLASLAEKLLDDKDTQARHSMPITFAADSRDGEEILLQGHMALVPTPQGDVAGYILSFETVEEAG